MACKEKCLLVLPFSCGNRTGVDTVYAFGAASRRSQLTPSPASAHSGNVVLICK